MRKIPAKGPTVKGIDIYHGDKIDDIRKVMESGVQFAYLKAVEYTVDPSFRFRWKALKNDGLLVGAYDFFHPSHDPIQQAENFLSAISPIAPGYLPPMLDWEVTDGMPTETDKIRAKAWLDLVEKTVGKTPIIYTAPYFAQALGLDESFKKYPLWIAHYGVSAPLVPGPWDAWTFWQYSESGNLPGMIGHCDLDLFNGTLDDLKAMCL